MIQPPTQIGGKHESDKARLRFFDLAGHPKAKRAYGWSHPEGEDNKGELFVTVREIPPVNSPNVAVKMAIYSDIKKGG